MWNSAEKMAEGSNQRNFLVIYFLVFLVTKNLVHVCRASDFNSLWKFPEMRKRLINRP